MKYFGLDFYAILLLLFTVTNNVDCGVIAYGICEATCNNLATSCYTVSIRLDKIGVKIMLFLSRITSDQVKTNLDADRYNFNLYIINFHFRTFMREDI